MAAPANDSSPELPAASPPAPERKAAQPVPVYMNGALVLSHEAFLPSPNMARVTSQLCPHSHRGPGPIEPHTQARLGF